MKPLLVVLGALLLCGCDVRTLHRATISPQDVRRLDPESPFLKCHLRDGGVYVLSPWKLGDDELAVTGHGTHLDADRRTLGEGDFTVPVDAVALFETNVVHRSPAVTALAIVTVASLAATVYCAANPKACFGSCPTFYVSDGTRPLLQAEGFSASIAPCLEATDVDALYRAPAGSPEVVVRMANEALETHVVRFVNLLALPRPAGGRTFAMSAGGFRQATRLVEPARCLGESGDCLAAVLHYDGNERFTEADSSDLSSRETLDLEFADVPDGELGVVVGCRQTLLSTYLFYQTLAYMGRSAGSWIAAMERAPSSLGESARGLGRELGYVDVLVRAEDGEWRSVGSVGETGPLASDVRVVEIPRRAAADGPLHVRLRLVRGLWRLDYLALASLGASVEPLRLAPTRVMKQGVEDPVATALLADGPDALITLPGDEYELVYELPERALGSELFLESRGYYLEWMREEWLHEEDKAAAAQIFMDPRGALQAMAPAFKAAEADMELTFWNSRYATH